MTIAGLQKLSLVDYPGKLACVVFTGGCNLRCPYCHNSGLWDSLPEAMSQDAFFDFLGSRRGQLDGVCVTGGEPCLQTGLSEFLKKIKESGFLVKLDSNGSYPEQMRSVIANGLVDYIAMDIKNSPDRYAETAGIDQYDLGSLLASADLVMAGKIPYEFRTTCVRPFHDREAIEGIRDLLMPLVEKGRHKIPHYYLQSFVDRATVKYAGLSGPDKEELADFKKILETVADQVDIR